MAKDSDKYSAPRRTFPTREELLRLGSCPERLEIYYDLWKCANEEAQQLAERLPAVFGDPPKPRITLRVARALDDDWIVPDERARELAKLDTAEHWVDVADKDLLEYQEYFSFADAEGWRFYLPAFLRLYLGEFPLSEIYCIHYFCVSRIFARNFTPEQIAFNEEFLKLCQIWESEG